MKKLFALIFLLTVVSCSKDDSIDTSEKSPYHQNPEVAENVIVILDDNSNLLSSETDLFNGIYLIEFNNKAPNIKTNDIIVGDQDQGYLRKVISVNDNGNTLTLQTSQATLDDVFNNATIEFSTDISESSKMSNKKGNTIQVNYLKNGITLKNDGLDYNFSNTVLYQEPNLTFEITRGSARFDPDFSFKADYSIFSGLNFLDFKTQNASLNIDCDLALNITGGISLPEFSTTLADFDKNIYFLVAGVPVVVTVNTQLVAELNASVDANIINTYSWSNNYKLNTGVRYENDNWTGNFDVEPELLLNDIDFGGQVNIAQNLTITPRVSVKFYRVVGPYCEPKMTEDFVFNINSDLDWDSNLKVGLDIRTGADITIFGKTLIDFSRTDSFEETIWNAPQTLEIVSGNDQNGEQGKLLDEPLKVKIVDTSGNPIPVVPVYFAVTQGNGTLDNANVMTDENGFAEVFWTLGDNTDTQSVEATVKKADGSNIESIATFNANSEESNSKWYEKIWYTESSGLALCEAQNGKEIKFYVNIIYNNGNYTAKVYFRNTGNVSGVDSQDFIINLETNDNDYIGSYNMTVGNLNDISTNDCSVTVFNSLASQFSSILRLSNNGQSLSKFYSFEIRGNNFQECILGNTDNCGPYYAWAENYNSGFYDLMTYIGTEAPDDL